MTFKRGIDPKAAVGIGILGKRGLAYSYPWIKRSYGSWHVKHCAWALDGWYKEKKLGISVFHFPCNGDRLNQDLYPEYVITAAPGESTDYDSMYRKIEYSEIISRFFHLLENDSEFESWIKEKNPVFLEVFTA